ncbi:MAG: permease [Thermoplasmatota archaeon]
MDLDGMIWRALISGWDAFADYVTNHTLTCLVPALFIAGAIAAFVKKEAILKYFGPNVRRYVSYPLAATSGIVLAVCSCTILPLFAGIYKKGSGIGPATAFLYSGPAINVLAIVYTASALGYDLGAARAVSAIVMSVVIGAYMSIVFRKHDRELIKGALKKGQLIPPILGSNRRRWVVPLFFSFLTGILVLGASSIDWIIKGPIMGAILISLMILIAKMFEKDEIKDWWLETWDLTKKIVPILIVGAFAVGVIAYFIPPSTFKDLLGNEGLTANFLAAVIGAILYMPTLLEVPIIGETFGYNEGIMGSGPALSLLLAGPAVSLPNMIVLYRIMGARKTAFYIALVIMISTMAGHIYGNLIVQG